MYERCKALQLKFDMTYVRMVMECVNDDSCNVHLKSKVANAYVGVLVVVFELKYKSVVCGMTAVHSAKTIRNEWLALFVMTVAWMYEKKIWG